MMTKGVFAINRFVRFAKPFEDPVSAGYVATHVDQIVLILSIWIRYGVAYFFAITPP
jgi:hypothetical protein